MDRSARSIQERLATIGLAAGRQYGLALAGGHAFAAHGLLTRASEDVDLFADWRQRDEFPTAVDAVIDAYEATGHHVDVDLRLETFARLRVTDPSHPDRPQRVELVANWRAHDPIEMGVGPVLHADDVVAGKVDALCNRAAARDFLDLDAAVSSGRYPVRRLCELARSADHGFDPRFFAMMLARIDRLDDDDFAAYGATPRDVAGLRLRVAAWRHELDVPG